MAGELLQKIKELKRLIIEKNNKEFQGSAVELINPNKVDEEVAGAHLEGEEHTEGDHAEKEAEMEALAIEAGLRKSISEEELAVATYIERAKKALKHDCTPLYELYTELAGDEMIHVATLRTALKVFGLEDKLKEIKGKLEAQEILGIQIVEEKDEHLEKMAKLRELADREKKKFDFVNEYVKNKLEYNKEKVVGAINDLIAGKSDFETAVDKIIKDGKKVVKDEAKKNEKDKKNKDEQEK